MSIQPQAAAVMNQRFGKDSLIALATVEEGKPFVRAVNAYYEDGSFYIITHALSNKMRQLAANPAASLCGDWFTGEGLGEDMGWLLSGPNQALADKLKMPSPPGITTATSMKTTPIPIFSASASPTGCSLTRVPATTLTLTNHFNKGENRHEAVPRHLPGGVCLQAVHL